MKARGPSTGGYRLVMGFWLGVMIFFLFGVTLPLFRAYPAERAGEVVRLLFPTYYLFLYACGGAAMILLILAREGLRRFGLAMAFIVVAMLAVVANQHFVARELDSLRLSGKHTAFQRLHGVSMALNLITLILAAGASAICNPNKN